MEVEDTGIGIAADQLESIFAPFAQADATTTRRFGGTGLGTTISRQLVELMQGHISVQSELGKGSVFSVRVPLKPGKPAQATTQNANISLPPLHILAVDDVFDNLELLQLTLSRQGHQLTLAQGGEEAVQQCKDGQHAFDVVLMDLQMPGVDGLEATRRIRQHEKTAGRPAIPIIALSASVLEEDRRNALAAGMNGFADKPLNPSELTAEIARLLGIQTRNDPLVTAHTLTSTQTPPPLPDSSRTSESLDASTVIDWRQALLLWEDEPRLRTAIRRFITENIHLAHTLPILYESRDWVALRSLAHRLRGVTGNLSLVTLQHALATLESAARGEDAAAVQQGIDMILPAWNECMRTFPVTNLPQATTDSLDSKNLAVTKPEQIETLHNLIKQSQQFLERGEIPDIALHALSAHLPAAWMASLHEALDRFDFQTALHQLNHLDAQITPGHKDTSP